ncbi:MAG: hypothetical protein AAGA18_14700 [Verrucomicrobiota bacterium]
MYSITSSERGSYSQASAKLSSAWSTHPGGIETWISMVYSMLPGHDVAWSTHPGGIETWISMVYSMLPGHDVAWSFKSIASVRLD